MWSITTTTPPVSTSGKKYSSVAERCAACEMRGGDAEGPCMKAGMLEAFQRAKGRPCPFVELLPGNAAAAELVPFLVSDSLRPLALEVWNAGAGLLPPEERRLVLLRVQRALGEKRVHAALYPWLKDKSSTKGKGN